MDGQEVEVVAQERSAIPAATTGELVITRTVAGVHPIGQDLLVVQM